MGSLSNNTHEDWISVDQNEPSLASASSWPTTAHNDQQSVNSSSDLFDFLVFFSESLCRCRLCVIYIATYSHAILLFMTLKWNSMPILLYRIVRQTWIPYFRICNNFLALSACSGRVPSRSIPTPSWRQQRQRSSTEPEAKPRWLQSFYRAETNPEARRLSAQPLSTLPSGD